MSKFMLRHFHYFRWLWRFILPPVLERAKRTKYRRHPTLVGILWIIHSSHVCRVRKMDKETRECGSCEYVFDTHHSNAWPASVLSQRGDAGMRENIRDARYRITHTLPHESIVTKKQKKTANFQFISPYDSVHFSMLQCLRLSLCWLHLVPWCTVYCAHARSFVLIVICGGDNRFSNLISRTRFRCQFQSKIWINSSLHVYTYDARLIQQGNTDDSTQLAMVLFRMRQQANEFRFLYLIRCCH